MAGVSPGASFSADSAPSIDTLKDLHEHCMSTFELLRSDPNCSSQRWREQFINLRDWGGSLSQDSYDPSVFINRLRNSAPLRDAIRNHLNALLAILRQGKASILSSRYVQDMMGSTIVSSEKHQSFMAYIPLCAITAVTSADNQIG